MKSFKQFKQENLAALSEAVSEGEQLLKDIETTHKKTFPKGWFEGNLKNGFGGGETISFSFGIVPKDKLPNKIKENDPGIHKFIIHIKDGEYEAKMLNGGVYVSPKKTLGGKYSEMDDFSIQLQSKIKTMFRKSKGSADKVRKAFTTWFPKVKKIVVDNKDNIYGGDRYDKGIFK